MFLTLGGETDFVAWGFFLLSSVTIEIGIAVGSLVICLGVLSSGSRSVVGSLTGLLRSEPSTSSVLAVSFFCSTFGDDISRFSSFRTCLAWLDMRLNL